MLDMQQEEHVHWRYEWPMKHKIKCLVQNLLARRQQQVLRRWLRESETLCSTEEMVYICEPKVGESLNDEEEKISIDLINYHGGSDENLDCQVGNERRSLVDLIDIQEGRGVILI